MRRLKHHLASARLKLVTRSVYAVVPPGSAPRTYNPDPFLVARAVRSDAIFSHHAAFELLGSAHSVWNDCTAYSKGRHRVLRLSRGAVRFLQCPRALIGQPLLGTRRVERHAAMLTTTGPERTLVESLRWPGLAGGLEEVIESARGLPVLDLDLVEHLLSLYRLSILWAATGWFLEANQGVFHVGDKDLDRFESARPASPQYLSRGARGGTLLRRWNLIVPNSLIDLGEPDDPGA